MKVGDRVRFIGPMYEHTIYPAVGALGRVVARDGHTAQKWGEQTEELVTVRFENDELDTVVSMTRLEVC